MLGFRAGQLDRVTRFSDGTRGNQLEAFARVGLLDRLPVDRSARRPEYSDANAPIEARARAYLDANCSSCHQPGGPGRGSMDLRFETPFASQGLCDVSPTAGDLGIARARLLAPREPDRSVQLARMTRRGPGAMPPLGTHRVDDAGVALIAQWISSVRDCTGVDRRRTVVLLQRETRPGQDLFVSGGIDHDAARALRGWTCTAENLRCAIPITHTRGGDSDAWLDWYGRESGQPMGVIGSPLLWTTNAWPASWGPERTVERDGYGVTPLNRVGPHYWMLDVEMDCARTIDGWFEVKAFLQGGEGWEPDIRQPGAPWSTRNHLARCGMLTTFVWGRGEARVQELAR